jgi:hypothetical protein
MVEQFQQWFVISEWSDPQRQAGLVIKGLYMTKIETALTEQPVYDNDGLGIVVGYNKIKTTTEIEVVEFEPLPQQLVEARKAELDELRGHAKMIQKSIRDILAGLRMPYYEGCYDSELLSQLLTCSAEIHDLIKIVEGKPHLTEGSLASRE